MHKQRGTGLRVSSPAGEGGGKSGEEAELQGSTRQRPAAAARLLGTQVSLGAAYLLCISWREARLSGPSGPPQNHSTPHCGSP